MFQKLSTGCYELYIEDLPQAKASEKGSQREWYLNWDNARNISYHLLSFKKY